MDDESRYNSLFPDMPREGSFINPDGSSSQGWLIGMQSLFQALQANFKNEGVVFPWLSEDDINLILDDYIPYIGQPLPQGVPDLSGQTVFDTTNRVSKQFVITYDGAPEVNVLSVAWRTLQYV